jgi:hypothetical protein
MTHISGQISATDADGDLLQFGIEGGALVGGLIRKVGLYGELAVNPNTGAYSFAPNSRAIQALTAPALETFALTISDSRVILTEGLLVNVQASNEAPIATIGSNQWVVRAAKAGQQLNPGDFFSDKESPSQLTFQVTGMPSGLTYDAAARAVTGTPQSNKVGSYTLTVTATDPQGLSTSTTAQLAVLTPGVGLSVRPEQWGNASVLDEITVSVFAKHLENDLVEVDFGYNATSRAFEARIFSKSAAAVGSYQFKIEGTALQESLVFRPASDLVGWQALSNITTSAATFLGYSANPADSTGFIENGDLIGTVSGHLDPSEMPALRFTQTEVGQQTAAPLSWYVLPAVQPEIGNEYELSGLEGGNYAVSAAVATARVPESALTASDAFEALRLALGVPQATGNVSPYELIAADVNRDGRVSAFDAFKISSIALGLEPAAGYVFLDPDQDLSSIGRQFVSYREGAELGLVSDGTHSVNLLAILLGDLSHSAVQV